MLISIEEDCNSNFFYKKHDVFYLFPKRVKYGNKHLLKPKRKIKSLNNFVKYFNISI